MADQWIYRKTRYATARNGARLHYLENQGIGSPPTPTYFDLDGGIAAVKNLSHHIFRYKPPGFLFYLRRQFCENFKG